METLEGMFDLGFALVRGKIRLGLSYIGVGSEHMKRFNLGGKKTLKWTIHARWYRY